MAKNKPRIGILTGGGDCPGLNAVIRAVVKAAFMRGWETVGFRGGYEGLLPPAQYCALDYKQLGGLLVMGGTILGTSNRGRFAAKTGKEGQVNRLAPKILADAQATAKRLRLKGLICVGGDGSLTIAQQLFEAGIPVVGVPKTIDNDLEATVMTFGFDSAVCCATDALDRLHTTAESHNRVLVLEVMGRHAGWIAVSAGISGGGDIILIPEIPFRYESICAKIREREKMGKHFTIVVAAEGARQSGGGLVVQDAAAKDREVRLGGLGAVVAKEIEKRTGKESRVCVLGHLQRGGGPTSFDRLLCTRFGARAVQLIADAKFGHMVALRPPDTVAVPITEAIGRLRKVPVDGDLVQTGRALGISFGD
ncbi:MAG: 6-phosphofructokinase [Elusimicrobia bacterium GWA2_69_24]|nr:MAG: 6-phosphofructokinase [Elusimicrobia bacterium GWA2_69_24]HBL16365.1 6-phosphofructokinase [Elusimicrobiota bacterium]